eukprot:2989278-Prymnesium_polylepis.1
MGCIVARGGRPARAQRASARAARCGRAASRAAGVSARGMERRRSPRSVSEADDVARGGIGSLRAPC